jgi:transcriptional regulator with XRE-family HTH domain
MEYKCFWDRVKPLIKAVNMTQEQFAVHLGINFNTLRNWIHYKRIPDLSTANDISIVLGVSLDYLLSGKDRDLTNIRIRELEIRKIAYDTLKNLEKIQKQLYELRPIPTKTKK